MTVPPRTSRSNARLTAPTAGRGVTRARTARPARRGVASVLAMMFLVIFGSLAAVMAVVAQGNLRTAHSHRMANRSMSAAETGLTFASRRLYEAGQRFIVERGTVDSGFGQRLWDGSWDISDGEVTILPPEGFSEPVPADSLASALINAHAADDHNIYFSEEEKGLYPGIDAQGRLVTPAIAVGSEDNAPYFRIIYEPLVDGRYIRVTCIGTDQDLTRTLQSDFLVTKRLDAAIISPSRIMIGKNVHIDGPIGTRYGEDPLDLEEENGHPIVLRSDFLDLDDALDAEIVALVEAVAEYDVDSDNRLRPSHPSEAEGLTEAYMVDYDQDGYVDDYDLWFDFYDENEDSMIAYDPTRALEVGYGNLDIEFREFDGSPIDEQLTALIDRLKPDRNDDGVVDEADTTLGYLDGVINFLDGYAKLRGTLLFKTSKSAWESAQGNMDVQTVLNGPLSNQEPGDPTMIFEAPDTMLYDLTSSDFSNSQSALKDATASSRTFVEQVTAQLGHAPEDHTWRGGDDQPDYLSGDLADWEQMPYGSVGFYDWYKRPVYRNLTFVDVKIPMGCNGLFENCTFVGATYLETYIDNQHINWNFLGMKEQVGTEYIDKYDYQHWDPPLTINGNPVYDTRPFSNNVRFDGCTFIGSVVTDPITSFTHVRNKVQFTGNTRFSLDGSEIDGTNLTQEEKDNALNDFNTNLSELEKSSLMAPNFSVDVGNFTNAEERVTLQGTIVTGVLDIRGSAEVIGTLLMTFRPVRGEGVLYYGGSPASFNTTIGYFGPDDGDGEGTDPTPEVGYGNIMIKYDPDIPLPDGIMAPLTIGYVRGTYVEGGAI
ncbi:MAG: hypothetical protein D8M59_03265 [Planctomycetes bacterium]|nr:hypothetical protein [Planctomycetota bacterium]NOG53016.1 pentapeptide repeat-containing protein [Planctomycetota bacterium]